jgi:Lysylphosphatidylglycerol synthase TM region
LAALDLWVAARDADTATVGDHMVDRLEGIGRTAAHAATLILDRAAEVDPRWLVLGTLLYLAAQSVRPLGWHTILRAAYPEATGLRKADTVRAYLAGSGINSIVPARGGDVAKLAMVHRRIEGARYPVLVATFVPETIFETAFGTGLVVWALAKGFLPVPTTTGELPSLDVSLLVEHPIQAGLIAAAIATATWLFIRFVKGSVRQGLAILGSPRLFVTGVASWQALARLIRLLSLAAFMAAFHLPVTPGTVVLVMAAQGGGRILPFAPVSAGLRLAMLSYGFVEVTGKSVDIAAITAFTFGVGAVLSISGLLVAAVILAREFGTLSPRGAMAAARERMNGAPWRRSLPESAT